MKILPRQARPLDVVGYGEASIDEVWRMPAGLGLGDKGRATGRDRLGGGQIATALVAAARLGARAGFLGPIGDDSLSAEIAAGLREEGVEVSPCAIGPGRSRTALILVEAHGERTVLEDGGVRGVMSEALVQALGRARALHLDGTQPAALALAQAASAAEVLVSLDLDHVPNEPGLIEHADVCALPVGLATRLTGERDAHAALEALARRGQPGALFIETCGPGGLVAWLDGAPQEQPAFPVDVVDTTACGDTLRGALLVALLDGASPREALRFATAAAALKCRAIGRRGCPRRDEVEQLLDGS